MGNGVCGASLGETAAIIFLARELKDCIGLHKNGSGAYFAFISFDGNNIGIEPGKVTVNGRDAYADWLHCQP